MSTATISLEADPQMAATLRGHSVLKLPPRSMPPICPIAEPKVILSDLTFKTKCVQFGSLLWVEPPLAFVQRVLRGCQGSPQMEANSIPNKLLECSQLLDERCPGLECDLVVRKSNTLCLTLGLYNQTAGKIPST